MKTPSRQLNRLIAAIEPDQAGMLKRESIPVTRSLARFSSSADHQASRHRCRAAGVADQSRVDQVIRISRTVPAAVAPA